MVFVCYVTHTWLQMEGTRGLHRPSPITIGGSWSRRGGQAEGDGDEAAVETTRGSTAGKCTEYETSYQTTRDSGDNGEWREGGREIVVSGER